MRTFSSLEELAGLVGQDVATSDWIAITQEQVDRFAEATGDRQWIHVDPERAKAGPFGGPIAHGFLTLSLLPKLFETAVHIEGTRMAVNYGLNKVRFTSPVPVGGRVRGHMALLACEPLEGRGMQITWKVTIELEGSDRPACIAESISRRYA